MKPMNFNVMIHLLFYALNRFLSGAKNGAFYAGKHEKRNIFTILLSQSSVFYGFIVIPHIEYTFNNYLVWLSIIPSLVYIHMHFYGMNKYLHLWESLGAVTFMGYGLLLGADIFLYPLSGMLVNIICFKGPINYYIGRKWVERIDGTDDPTGKTLGFPTPWGFFKRPRISNGYTQLILGIILMAIWFIIQEVK